MQNISLGGYVHDLTLVNLALDLSDKYEVNFIPERRLRFWGGLGGVGIEGHIPDGVLEFSEKKKWAIELELSVKAASRLKKIIDGYAANFEYEEVHYFVNDNIVKNAVEKAISASGATHIRIELLKEDYE